MYMRVSVMKQPLLQITWPGINALKFVQAENSVGRGYAPDGSCPHQGDAPDLQGPLLPLHAQPRPCRHKPRNPQAPWPHPPPHTQTPPGKTPKNHTHDAHHIPTPKPPKRDSTRPEPRPQSAHRMPSSA